MDENLGRGYIDVEVRGDVARELARINAEVSASMDAISRKKAEIGIKGNIADLKRAVDEAKAKLGELEAAEKREAALNESLAAQKKSASTVRLNNLREEIKGQQEQIVSSQAQRAEMQQVLDASRRQGELDRTLAKEKQTQWKAEAAARDARNRQIKLDEAAAASRARSDLDEIKRRQEIIRLQQAYNTAAQKAKDLENLPRQQRDQPAEQVRIKVDTAAAKLEMLRTQEELRLLGHKPVQQDLTLNDKGAIDRLRNFAGVGRNQAGVVDTLANSIQNLGEKLAGTRVNIGPFSTSIIGLGTAIAALSPIITGVLGGLGSLVAVMGAGIGGAAGVGAAGLSGFGLAALGIKTATINAVAQLQTFHGALNAFQKAQLLYGPPGPKATTPQQQQAAANRAARIPLDQQRVAIDQRNLNNQIHTYGQNSIQAQHATLALASAHQTLSNAQAGSTATSNRTQKALDKLNSVIAQSPPAMRAAERQWLSLASTWQKLTGTVAQRDLGGILADTFKTANANVQWYAKDTNQAFDAVRAGWGKWMADLRRPEAQGVLQNIFGNFNRSIPNILNGLGSLASAFGRIVSQFSNFLPGLSKGFADWAQHIADSAKNSDGFASGVSTMVASMRDFGHFAEAAARWLITFFSAGVGPGQHLLNDFTSALNRSNEAMKTTEKGHLADFFQQGVVTLERLVSLIAPLISLLAKFAQAFAPALNLTLQWAGALANAVSAILTFKPLDYAVGVLALVALVGRLGRGFWDAAKGVGSMVENIGKAIRGGGLKALFGIGGAAATGSEIGVTATEAMLAGAPEIGAAIGAAFDAAATLGGAGAAAAEGGAVAAGAAAPAGAAATASIAGPIAIAAAPLILGAVGYGIVGLFDHAGSEFGTKLSDKVFKVFGAGVAGGPPGSVLSHNTAPAFANISNTQAANAANLSSLGRVAPAASSHNQVSSQGAAALDKAYRDAGNKAAQQFEAGLKGVQFKTEPAIFDDFKRFAANMPPRARFSAAKSVLEWAHGLEQNHQLPKGATAKLLRDLEGQFPGFRTFMRNQGVGSAKDFARGMQLRDAQSNLQQSLGNIRNQFGLLAADPTATGSKLTESTGKTMALLKTIYQHSTGQIHDLALANFTRLRTQSMHQLDVMIGQSTDKIGVIKALIAGGSADGVNQASANFSALETNIYNAMNNGTISAGEGAKLLKKNLEIALKEFGGTPLPDAIYVSMAANNPALPVRGRGLGHQSAATGGVFQVGQPGAAGRDDVPINAGGTNIMVGNGEKVAVFNRHQQALMDNRLSDMGGLTGMFSKVNRPHYMAAGGIAFSGPVSTFGPPSEAAGTTALAGHSSSEPGISLRMPGTHWSDAANVALKGHVFKVTVAGHSTNLLDIDLGPADWTGKNIDVTGAGVAALGIPIGAFPTGAIGSVQEIAGGVVTALGAGAGKQFKHLRDPTVKGKGRLPVAVAAGLHKVTKAMNDYGDKIAAKWNAAHAASSFVGGGATSGPPGLAVFEGVTMAKWIADELIWATQHGWHGQPTSGYRPGFDPHTASGTSEHQLTSYPGGAVDFGGFTDPAAYATKLALVQLAAALNYPGPRLMMPVGFHDDGHLSGTGHAAGGIVNKPMLLVGEEHKKEYVISTNPAYRQANLGYLSNAARDLGIETAARGRQPQVIKPPKASRITPQPSGPYGTDPRDHAHDPFFDQHLDTSYLSRYGLSKRAHHGISSIEPLPPSARIGPNTDTSDIQALIDSEYRQLQGLRSRKNKVSRDNSRIRQRNLAIKQYNADPKHKHKKQPLHLESYPNDKHHDQGQGAINKLGKDVNLLKDFLRVATEDGKKFTNLETEISTLDTALQTADISTDGTAFFEGKNLPWNELKLIRDRDMKEHTRLLKQAYDNAKRLVGRNPPATDLAFVKGLEQALGTSIFDQTTDFAATQTPKAAADVSLDDFVAFIGETKQLERLNLSEALAETTATSGVTSPATIAADKGLMDFYQDVLTKAETTGNVPLITDAAHAFASARDTYNGLIGGPSSAGPGQVQLYEAERANVLQAFGSNIALPAYAAGGYVGGMAAGGMVAAPQKGHTINNFFTQPPDDPHTWSQGIAWELGAMS